MKVAKYTNEYLSSILFPIRAFRMFRSFPLLDCSPILKNPVNPV